jgi:hypothetical protein
MEDVRVLMMSVGLLDELAFLDTPSNYSWTLGVALMILFFADIA